MTNLSRAQDGDLVIADDSEDILDIGKSVELRGVDETPEDAGTVMQMLVRNRFVEPMTAGTGQGAALGILLVTVFAPAAPIAAKMGLAALTALLTSLGFLAIVRRLPPTQPLLVPLVGLVSMAGSSAQW